MALPEANAIYRLLNRARHTGEGRCPELCHATGSRLLPGRRFISRSVLATACCGTEISDVKSLGLLVAPGKRRLHHLGKMRAQSQVGGEYMHG